jgi:hypothetical protein
VVGAFASSEAVGEAFALPPEIAFLERHGVARATLAHAARLAERCAMPADGVAIREGLVPEETFYRALAAETRLPFLSGPFDVNRSARFPECVTHGLAPLDAVGAEPEFAYAPTGRQLCKLLAAVGRCPVGLAIATPTALRQEVMRARAGAVADLAANGLPRVTPHLSYREGASIAQWCSGCATGAAVTASFAWAPALTADLGAVSLGLVFLASTAPRLAAPLESIPVASPRPRRQDDRNLPVYTVIVPLHRERRVLPKLLSALSALDYPALCSKCTTNDGRCRRERGKLQPDSTAEQPVVGGADGVRTYPPCSVTGSRASRLSQARPRSGLSMCGGRQTFRRRRIRLDTPHVRPVREQPNGLRLAGTYAFQRSHCALASISSSVAACSRQRRHRVGVEKAHLSPSAVGSPIVIARVRFTRSVLRVSCRAANTLCKLHQTSGHRRATRHRFPSRVRQCRPVQRETLDPTPLG